jgi:hypothetical protein
MPPVAVEDVASSPSWLRANSGAVDFIQRTLTKEPRASGGTT